MNRKRIHFLYSVLLSILLVIAGLCMMIACVGIYNAGDQPFSREAVAVAFGRISIPVYTCLAGVIAGLLLDLLLPEDPAPVLPGRPYARILATYRKRVDLSLCDPETRHETVRLERNRRLHKTVSHVLLLIGSAVFLVYAMNPANYPDAQINGAMKKAVYVLLATVALPFGYGIFNAFYGVSSIRREIDVLKQAPAAAKKAAVKTAAPDRGKAIFALRTAVLAVAVACLLFGFFTGGTADVMTKAINICTECVGLG